MANRTFRALGVLFFASFVTGCGASDSGGSPVTSSGGSSGQSAMVASGGTSGGVGGSSPAGSGGDTTLVIDDSLEKNGCADHDISVLFLIDRSGSMNCNLPPLTESAACEAMSPPAKVDATAPSKWEVISDTLGKALGQLVPTDPTIHVRAGVAYFSIDGTCGASSTPAVPVADATPAQLDAIRASVTAQKPKGGTPIVGATMLGYRYLYQTLGVTGGAHVVLITDGADSCADYYAANPAIGPGDHVADLIATQAPKAKNFGIKTWVIGAPGSEPARYTLSSLSIAGGTRRSDDCNPGTSTDGTSGDCHYDMTRGDFQTALQTALTHIMAVVTCQVAR